MGLKPILKVPCALAAFSNLSDSTLFSTTQREHPAHVHFPPTPQIVAATHEAYPASVYDRAPIVVSPNACALPRRGERVYSTCEVRDYFHPRAREACERTSSSLPPTSPLASTVPSDEAGDAFSPNSPEVTSIRPSLTCDAVDSACLISRTRSYDDVQSARVSLSLPPSPGQDEVRKSRAKKSGGLLCKGGGSTGACRALEARNAFTLLALDDCLAGF